MVGVLVVMVVPFTWRQRFSIAILGTVLTTLVWMAVPGLVGTIRSLFVSAESDPSVQGRLGDFAVVAPLIADRPWFGRGPGTFSSEQYVLLDNQWLGTLIGIGVVGLLALLGVFLVAVALAIAAARRTASPADTNLGYAIASAIIGSIVASFLFDSLFFSKFALTSFVLIGTAGALWRMVDDNGQAHVRAVHAAGYLRAT